jgi:hypothetical protein
MWLLMNVILLNRVLFETKLAKVHIIVMSAAICVNSKLLSACNYTRRNYFAT